MLNKKEEVKEQKPEREDFKKVLNNTLCGLSNIQKDSMDNESSYEEEREASNAFQNNGETVVNNSNIPSSINDDIRKAKENNEEYKKNNITTELAQQIVKQTAIFDSKHK